MERGSSGYGKKINFQILKLIIYYVDNAAMKIITNPSEFDVILTENMFGDIITDEASVYNGFIGNASFSLYR